MTESLWSPSQGRELDSTLLYDTPSYARVIACLNVWNDVDALRTTVPTWLKSVDGIIAVDGAYDTAGALSTDGTREFLMSLNKTVVVLNGTGMTQCEKRSLYFRQTNVGDMLFIIDADEQVAHADTLRELPACDVGWVRVHSPFYAREYGQPRIIRNIPKLEYRGRHHWIYQGDRLVCTHQYGGASYEHRILPLTIYNHRHRDTQSDRASIVRRYRRAQVRHEQTLRACPSSDMSDSQIKSREALHICQRSYRDDGLAPSRLHTAINRTTPHSSLFFKVRPGPYNAPEQFIVSEHRAAYEEARKTCDIMHYHSQISIARGHQTATPFVFHHHGTMLRNNADAYNRDALDMRALVLLSNLELFSWVETDAQYLPNPVPVARYRKLHAELCAPFTGNNTFRIAHSPSQPDKKGTDVLHLACNCLKAKGVPIEIILIENYSHAEALRLKATCHACFDSFWLGMQCSGIEAAAMGIPVVAGDDIVASRYRQTYGYVPYTFADDAPSLEYALFRLVDDASYRANEGKRVSMHVEKYHDEAAVALQYLDYLDTAFHWRSLSPHQRTGKIHAHQK